MKHFAANFIFDGENFLKNACVSFSDDGTFIELGEENSGLIERERMIFYNGILCPHFSLAKFAERESLSLKDVLKKMNLRFSADSKLPIIIIENLNLFTLEFTDKSFVKEIF